jgi:hypothetical protein
MRMQQLISRLEESSGFDLSAGWRYAWVDKRLLDIKGRWKREWPIELVRALAEATDELRDRATAIDQYNEKYSKSIRQNGGVVDDEVLKYLIQYVHWIREEFMVPAHKKAGLMDAEDGRITDYVLTDALMRIAYNDLDAGDSMIGSESAMKRWLKFLNNYDSPWN